MTKIEIIDDTVAYYSADPTRRSIEGSQGRCLYKGPEGKECAFQRVVENDLSEYDGANGFAFGSTCQSVMSSEPDLKFKEGYEGHDVEFWSKIQSLHDISDHWNDEGLTEIGKEYVECLKNKYSEN